MPPKKQKCYLDNKKDCDKKEERCNNGGCPYGNNLGDFIANPEY